MNNDDHCPHTNARTRRDRTSWQLAHASPRLNSSSVSPYIPCYDVSGTIVRLLSTASRFKLGDKIYGRVAAARE
jgi:NADPH:quinone reductase-like Zn-dependent oxidoreductase